MVGYQEQVQVLVDSYGMQDTADALARLVEQYTLLESPRGDDWWAGVNVGILACGHDCSSAGCNPSGDDEGRPSYAGPRDGDCVVEHVCSWCGTLAVAQDIDPRTFDWVCGECAMPVRVENGRMMIGTPAFPTLATALLAHADSPWDHDRGCDIDGDQCACDTATDGGSHGWPIVTTWGTWPLVDIA